MIDLERAGRELRRLAEITEVELAAAFEVIERALRERQLEEASAVVGEAANKLRAIDSARLKEQRSRA